MAKTKSVKVVHTQETTVNEIDSRRYRAVMARRRRMARRRKV